MTATRPPGLDWTVVLRRQPARMVAGQPEGGYTDSFEIICCHCGDEPDLDYCEVSPELQRIRGPYLIAAGVAAYTDHLRRHHSTVPATGLLACGNDRLGGCLLSHFSTVSS